MTAVKSEKTIKNAISGIAAHDSRSLEKVFEVCRTDEKKMTLLIRAFCEAYLIDNKQRPLKLRPLQETIIVKSLTHPSGDPTKQRKLAILAPRGSGKSYALSVAVTIYMFFNRFRDLIFILAPSEDQASLIFNYCYRHFADNTFLNGLIDHYRFHNKPNITMKGGTVLRRAPLAPSNQGQAIRGQHPTMCIVDESPLIDDRLFVDNVEPAIVSNRAPFINLGTPKSKENHMYRYLYDDAYDGTFERMVFTWRDAIKVGRAYSSPYTEEDMMQKQYEWGEDSIYWKTEYECEFVESVSNIFNPELVKSCLVDETFPIPGKYPNCVVGVDIGKSVNSTVISVWATGKTNTQNVATLIYIEEIGPKTGGHDIPFQRRRIMNITNEYGADRLIVDCTGMGGAIEQDLRLACIQSKPQINFIPFIFTGGPRGTKTQMYRDYVSFVQQRQVRVPHYNNLSPEHAKLVRKWVKEHIDLEYVMDAANKTERIAAPDGKHDDYCDSSAMALHASLSMLPAEGTFSSVSIGSNISNEYGRGKHTSGGLFTTKRRSSGLNKHKMRGI
tara:strand:- start:580 stop:2247 length:1668 start_codon:yes stop_codon:yes gene_type:complete